MEQVSMMMSEHGHFVHVFCGTKQKSYSTISNHIYISRIYANNLSSFRENVIVEFEKENASNPFDIIEGPDYGADAYLVKLNNIKIPYTIKLHTPAVIIKEYNNYFLQYVYPNLYISRFKKFIIRNKKNEDFKTDIEYLNLKIADTIFSPSNKLADKLSKRWDFEKQIIGIIPNPYKVDDAKKRISLEYSHGRISFIGKLSILKGAMDFSKIIPTVLQKLPHLKFRFIGEDSFSHISQMSMKEYLLSICEEYASQMEFTGKVPLKEIVKYLSETDILVCNSLWENYPTVILEAMAAGRVVIGSRVGGIPEIIEDGVNGIIVNPKSPKAVSHSIINCYRHKYKMEKIGISARDFINELSKNDSVYDKMMLHYKKTIALRCPNHCQ